MKTCLLILSVSYIFSCFAQSSDFQNRDSSLKCNDIIDSLNKTGYFRKAKQVDLQDTPIKAYIAFDNLEVLYSDGEGYIVSFNKRSEGRYSTFWGSSFLTNIISAMNESFLFDSTFMIINPNHTVVTGASGISLKIYLVLSNGEIVENDISSDAIIRYCIYPYKFREYLGNLRNRSFQQIDLNMAFYLKSKFNSRIFEHCISAFGRDPLIMEPQKIEIKSKQEIKTINDSFEYKN
jgi:hypothetical protein